MPGREVSASDSRRASSRGSGAAVYAISIFDILFVSHLVLLSIIYGAVLDGFHAARTVVLYLILFVNVLAAAVSVQYNWKCSAFAGISALAIFGYMGLFAYHFGTGFTGALIASFPGLLAAGIFGICLRQNSVDKTMLLVFAASLIYAALFLFMSARLNSGSLTALSRSAGGLKSAGGVVFAHNAHGGEAGNLSFRVRASGVFLTFAFLYSLERLRDKFSLIFGAAFLFSATCIVRSDFRLLLVMIAATVLALFVPVAIGRKAKGAFLWSLILVFAFVICAAFSINPFALLKFDASGSGGARAVEAAVALDTILKYPFFGAGLINQSSDYFDAYHRALAPSDLGTWGVMMQYGIPGLLFQIFCNYIIYSAILKLTGDQLVSRASQNVLLGSFICLVIAQLITTQIVETDGTVIVVLALAIVTQRERGITGSGWRLRSKALRARTLVRRQVSGGAGVVDNKSELSSLI